MRITSYFYPATEILQHYDGSIPFAAWIKAYFREHKKFGSRDRKIVSDLCYCFFRLGNLFAEKSMEERFTIAQFLCRHDSPFIKELEPDWAVYLSQSLSEKLSFLEANPEFIFPFVEEVSNEIDKKKFAASHLVQPDLFLRIRPGRKETVIKKLQNESIPFHVSDDCIQLPNTTKVHELIELNKDVVVQDKSSQKVLDPLKEICKKDSFTSWDCCAASGGKSILLHDLYPKVKLTVSDIRESILHNLRSRFRQADIHQYQSFVADVSAPSFQSNKKYDVIICDAPCSGSGTWGRTPEQLQFFKQDKISYYADLQKRIAANASKSLKKDGMFVYITCSVFKKENEEVVSYLSNHTSLQLKTQQYFKGYSEKADTLFVALFSL